MSSRWNKNYIRLGIVLTLSVCTCILFSEIIQEWKGIFSFVGGFFSALTPFVVGVVLAFLLNPIMLYIRKGLSFLVFKLKLSKKKQIEMGLNKEQKADRYDAIYKKTKAPSLILTVLVFIGIIVGFMWLVIPSIYASLQRLVLDIPRYLTEIQDWATKMFSKNEKLESIIRQNLEYIEETVMGFFEQKIMPNMDTIVLKISTGVVVGVKAVLNFFVGLIVMIYLLGSKETLIAQGKKMIYCLFSKKRGNKIMNGLSYANTVFGGFINGKILDSLIIGLMCFVFTHTMDMTYDVLISVIVGVTNIIPFFGPFIGAVPGALLALMDDPIMFLIFIVFVLILQQFDGNILGPIILGDSTGLSGIWVLFAILVGGDLFGVVGMILGVPVFACIYAFLAVWLRDTLRAKKLSSKTEDYFRLVGFDEKTGKPIYRDKHEERFTARQRKKRNLKLWRKQRELLIMEQASEEAYETEESVIEGEAAERDEAVDNKMTQKMERQDNVKTDATDEKDK